MSDETRQANEAHQPDPAVKGKMLPGIAGIAVFLLVLTLLNAFAAIRNTFGTGGNKMAILALCTLLLAGLSGLIRMQRWGHAVVLAGTLLLSASYFYLFTRLHELPFVLQGFFMLLFFLYLVRPEVRDRMI